jgi:hypothetical protein
MTVLGRVTAGADVELYARLMGVGAGSVVMMRLCLLDALGLTDPRVMHASTLKCSMREEYGKFGATEDVAGGAAEDHLA